MVTETPPESSVPESAYTDYEHDLLNDDVPPAQARAARRALERIVDRFAAQMATKADLRDLRSELRGEIHNLRTELRGEIRDLRADHGEKILQLLQDVAALKAEMRILKWMLAVFGPAVIGLMAAVLAVLLTRL